MQRDPAEYTRRMKRQAAVAVSMLNVDNEASLLFTVRSEIVGTHAGHVSFPGGHVEEGETFEAAACRELNEETNLVGFPICRYHAVRAMTGTMVTPVLCFVQTPLIQEQVQNSKEYSDEVSKVFSLKISDLFVPESRTVEELRDWQMPRFNVGSNPSVWGLTAFILDGVLRDVFAPVFNIERYPPREEKTNDSHSIKL